MEYLVGVILGLVVGGFATTAGFDRDRSFYPTVLIVIASYYALFALMGANPHPALEIEIAVGLVFAVLAVLGFKKNIWLAAIGIGGHGFFDFFVHHALVTNSGMPVWWPGFCGTIDIVIGGWLAACLWKTRKTKLTNLKVATLSVTLAPALLFAPTSYGQNVSACQTGRLLDVHEETAYIPTVQFGRVHRNGSKDWTTVGLASERKQTTYTVKVALDGIIYTARSSGDFWGYNPSQMIIGSEVQACVEANKLVITRPDGKQYKPAITRREREQAAAGH